ERLQNLRNIGISAHIDSGKTTLTERILYYTGRIDAIHEVRGKDGVGAKMDSMDLEREKGITIQSAATYTKWRDTNINIIDTPGHVDFTVEVERALRVLDGAVLVLCSVGGVQSQTLTVDRQMKRYDVPAICFVNKLDRPGGNAHKIVDQLRAKLHHNAALIQMPIGIEENLEGCVDLIRMECLKHEGENGEIIARSPVTADLLEEATRLRHELIECVSNVDDELAEMFLDEIDPTPEQLSAAIRRATVVRKFTPVCVGTALKNKGVQPLLDVVLEFLPAPHEVENYALDITNNEEKVFIDSTAEKKPLVMLAFKLEEGKYGQLTYMRVYQGKLRRGDLIQNITASGKKIKVSRLVRMHSDEMEEVTEIGSGEICALFGMDCASGDTFTDGSVKYAMSSMHVPSPVISLAVEPTNKNDQDKLGKALSRFVKEDPTFRVHVDDESGQTIVSVRSYVGMGELHLEVYLERIKREYNCSVKSDKPKVAFRETLGNATKFDYLHKKQSGGSGQYGRIIGELIPTEEQDGENEFETNTVGQNIPTEYLPAIEKGFFEACAAGPLIGAPVTGTKMILRDGAAHAVDSNEMAFKLAAKGAFRTAMEAGGAIILEPMMKLEVSVPDEFQGGVMGGLNKRKGMINDTDASDGFCTITAEIPLANMFGYSSELRSSTQVGVHTRSGLQRL
ncbi:elongation factor G, mitochondrial, partial [Sphaeroforma arctica JP610]